MGSSRRYGAAPQSHTVDSVVRRIRGSWWWYDGVRFVQSGDQLYGWRLAPWGQPVCCGRWLIPWSLGRGLGPWLEDIAMGLLKKGDKQVGGVRMKAEAADDPLVLAHPVLWDFLTAHEYMGGEVRQPGSLLIFEQDGMLKAMLRDRDDGTCLWVAARGLAGLFAALEASLCDPAADWRLDRKGPGDQASRVKKR